MKSLKKLLAISLAVAFVLSSVSLPVSATVTSSGTFYQEDFTGQESNTKLASIGAGSNPWAYVNEEDPADQQKVRDSMIVDGVNGTFGKAPFDTSFKFQTQWDSTTLPTVTGFNLGQIHIDHTFAVFARNMAATGKQIFHMSFDYAANENNPVTEMWTHAFYYNADTDKGVNNYGSTTLFKVEKSGQIKTNNLEIVKKLTPNKWYHFDFVFDMTDYKTAPTTATPYDVYVDGQLVQSTAFNARRSGGTASLYGFSDMYFRQYLNNAVNGAYPQEQSYLDNFTYETLTAKPAIAPLALASSNVSAVIDNTAKTVTLANAVTADDLTPSFSGAGYKSSSVKSADGTVVTTGNISTGDYLCVNTLGNTTEYYALTASEAPTPSYDDITALDINTPQNLEQNTDSLASVAFSVDTTPATNVDTSKIEWYVNTEKQSTTGTSFTYTPTAIGTYSVFAKVSGTEVVSATKDIVVTAPPVQPITALALNTTSSLAQNVGAISAVTFTADTTPASNVDLSTIEWYVNDSKQSTTGETFTYTPSNEVGTYNVYAKIKDTDVVSDTKTISVAVHVPADDASYLNENFDDNYNLGDSLVTSANAFTMVPGTSTAVDDPVYPGNLVGRYIGANKTDDDFQQIRNTIPDMAHTYYISGNVMRTLTTDTNYDIAVRTGSYKVLIDFSKSSTGNVNIAGASASAYVANGEWTHYVLKLMPNVQDPANSSLKVFLFGGLLNDEDNCFESNDIKVDLSAVMSGTNPYLWYRSIIPKETENAAYVDNMRVYTTTDFMLTADKSSDVGVDEAVKINFNHDVNLLTLTKEAITVSSASGNAEIESISYNIIDPTSVTLNFAQPLEEQSEYTVTLGGAIKDVAGNSAINTASFTTASATPSVPAYNIIVSAQGSGEIIYNAGLADEENLASGATKNLVQGTEVTLTAQPSNESTFMHWKAGDSGRILSEDTTYSFIVGSAKSVTAVFKDTSSGNLVIFKNGRNDQIVKSEYVADKVIVPANPFVMGYEFTCWIKDGINQTFNASDEIDIIADSLFVSSYTKSEQEYTITVTGGSGSGTYKYNDRVTAVADTAVAGKKFSHWANGGNAVSYNESYAFYVGGDATIEAVYVVDTETVTKEPILAMSAPVVLEGLGRIAFFAERDLPTEYTLVETGILLSQNADFDLSTAGVLKGVSTAAGVNKGQYTVRKSNLIIGDTWYGRAYMIYQNGTDIVTMYSNIVTETMR